MSWEFIKKIPDSRAINRERGIEVRIVGAGRPEDNRYDVRIDTPDGSAVYTVHRRDSGYKVRFIEKDGRGYDKQYDLGDGPYLSLGYYLNTIKTRALSPGSEANGPDPLLVSEAIAHFFALDVHPEIQVWAGPQDGAKGDRQYDCRITGLGDYD